MRYRNPIGTLERNIKKAIKDIENPNGKFASLVKENTKETASMFAELAKSTIHSSRNVIYNGLKSSWIVDYPKRIELVDYKKMDEYVDKRAPTKKSIYNPKKYPPYWRFLYEGFGRLGGKRSDDYLNYHIAKAEGGVTVVSPYDPNLGYYAILRTHYHKGKKGTDWFGMFENEYKDFFSKRMQIKINNYFKKIGLR